MPLHSHLTLLSIWTLGANASYSEGCQLIHVDLIELRRAAAVLQILRSHQLLPDVLTFVTQSISDHRREC